MKSVVSLLLAAAVIALALSPLTDAAGPTKASTVTILGPKVGVPPSAAGKPKFVKAFARCPAGYTATGGGVYNGAISEIAVAPLPNGRGWLADGANITPSGQGATFSHTVAVTCAQGRHQARATAAAVGADDLRRLEREWVAAQRER